ncbi:retropepsin-like aspartic protease [uncultured Oceanisphaera sp.]|uniref:retropepsin-like aspartic protease family protein n=1 Tax=uncultured Oceanisphaera sp. TaxID=353858 RepID=UPI00260F3D38|nr:retropepsin-like aspartic protease [uncultured Oceanisphaera sp.]
MSKTTNTQRRLGRIMWLLAWGLGMVLLTWYFQQKLEQDYNPNQQVQRLDARTIVLEQNRQGHYLAGGSINGEPVVFLLDTGATQVAIPQAVAARLGLEVEQAVRLSTAAGVVTGYRTRLKTLSLGPFTLYDLNAIIMPADSDEILLGMNALRQFELIQRDGQMTLKR